MGGPCLPHTPPWRLGRKGGGYRFSFSPIAKIKYTQDHMESFYIGSIRIDFWNTIIENLGCMVQLPIALHA